VTGRFFYRSWNCNEKSCKKSAKSVLELKASLITVRLRKHNVDCVKDH
jgi:hypothetical protein